jgi:hypothetical protein
VNYANQYVKRVAEPRWTVTFDRAAGHGVHRDPLEVPGQASTTTLKRPGLGERLCSRFAFNSWLFALRRASLPMRPRSKGCDNE